MAAPESTSSTGEEADSTGGEADSSESSGAAGTPDVASVGLMDATVRGTPVSTKGLTRAVTTLSAALTRTQRSAETPLRGSAAPQKCAATRCGTSRRSLRRRRLGGGHGPHRRVHHGVRGSAHVRGRCGHLVVGCGHRCHGSSQAGTTDSEGPEKALSTGFKVTNRSRSPTSDRCRPSGVSRLGAGAPHTSTTGWCRRPESRAATAATSAPYPA